MKKIQERLIIIFCGAIGLTLLIVLLFETGIIFSGELADNKSLEFAIATLMELLTICVIPFALRLFKMGVVKKRLISPESLYKWGILRLLMLCVPMLINCLLYYLFLNVAFGYMSIILFLCLFFVVPTMERCKSEIDM